MIPVAGPWTLWRHVMKSILDPTFRYTPSHATDLRKTFARARRRAKEEAARPGAKPANIVSLSPLRKPAA